MGVPTVRRYELLAPPGFDGEQELKRVMTWLGWAVVIMLAWFLLAYWSELSTVRSYRENGTPIGMRPYAEVAAFAYLPFVPVFAGFVYLLLRNWNYFRSGSKSFYTMRRLKEPLGIPRSLRAAAALRYGRALALRPADDAALRLDIRPLHSRGLAPRRGLGPDP